MKILVAEDTPIHKNLLKHLLTDQFNITENDIVFAADGQKALKHIEHTLTLADNGSEIVKLYDLLIMDYQMPQMNGLEVIRKIMPIYNRKKIPLPKIVFATAVADPEIKKICEMYTDYFLMKPLTKESLSTIFDQMRLF